MSPASLLSRVVTTDQEVLGSKLRPVLNVSLKPLFTPDMIFLLSHMRGGTS